MLNGNGRERRREKGRERGMAEGEREYVKKDGKSTCDKEAFAF